MKGLRLIMAASALAGLTGGGALPAMAQGTRAAAKPAKSMPATARRWPAFRDSFMEELFRLDPNFAVYEGRHDFDGQIQDWSPAGLKRLGDFYRRSIAAARAMPMRG